MSDWIIAGAAAVAVAALLFLVWRAEPRGPGKGFRRLSLLFGGPLGEGIYRGADAKRRQGKPDGEETEEVP